MAASKKLNWEVDIGTELNWVNWDALTKFAIDVKRRRSNHTGDIVCQLSNEYKKGGLHLVRRLEFPHDQTIWVARLQLQKATPDSIERLQQEVHTIEVIREKTKIPVPEIIDYEASGTKVGVAFMLSEYIPADTAMDSFAGDKELRGRIPPAFKPNFYAKMAKIQVDMASVRFSKIGSITKLDDGTYSVEAIPGIGGPFDTAAEFFCAWANNRKFRYNESTIRERTPSDVVDDIIKSINDFPSQLQEFTKDYTFQTSPFPLYHTDLYTSNILVDHEYSIQAVIDWENAIVAPWELIEVVKTLTIVPPVMEGQYYKENKDKLNERDYYLQAVKNAEAADQFDNKLSEILSNQTTQNLAHAFWLYSDGRIGYYSKIFELF